MHEVFTIRIPEGDAIDLKLIESVDESKEGNELFWFIFEGPVDRPLPQMTYSLEHTQLGELPMFLVPVATSNNQVMHYQSIFNRV